jgi:hypothetical protein
MYPEHEWTWLIYTDYGNRIADTRNFEYVRLFGHTAYLWPISPDRLQVRWGLVPLGVIGCPLG